MSPGGSRTICTIYHIFPRLELYTVYTDLAQHPITPDTGSTVDGLDDLHSRSSRWCIRLSSSPGIGQFREFESPRVHTRKISWGIVLVNKLTCEKRDERELATPDEKSTSSGIAEPYAR